MRRGHADERRAQDRIQRPALEFNLTQHCNLRCARCDHASPLLPEGFAVLAGFRRDMSILAEVLHAGELKLVGGEPLLHPELPAFLDVARATGIADRVTVVTNGVLLHRLDPSFLEGLDKLSISIYPGVRLRSDLQALGRLADAVGFELEVLRVDAFRETLLDRPHQDDDVVRAVYRDCGLAHRWSCHTVLDGRYYKCSPAPFLGQRLAARGRAVSNRELDGVRLRRHPDLRDELERYLSSPEPLAACRWCLGSSGAEEPHRQLTPQEPAGCDDPRPAEPARLGRRRRLRGALRRASALAGGRLGRWIGGLRDRT